MATHLKDGYELGFTVHAVYILFDQSDMTVMITIIIMYDLNFV